MAITTVIDKATGDIFSEAMWDTYIKDNINELIGRSTGQLLVNGGMEICQRGAGPFTGGGTAVFGLDCWKGNRTNPAGTSSVAMSQDATTVDAASAFSMKCVVSYTAITSEVYQKLEEVVSLRGKQLTFSIRINQPVASSVTPFFRVDGVKTYGAASATTGGWVTLTQTAAMGAGVAAVEVGVEFGASSNTYYLDNAMLVRGPVAAEYVPLHPAQEVERCQRYYEVHGAVNTSLAYFGYGAAGGGIGQIVSFNACKPATPTITKNGTWAVANCGQPAVSSPSPNGYTLSVTVTALGSASFNANSTDDTVTSEYNP